MNRYNIAKGKDAPEKKQNNPPEKENSDLNVHSDLIVHSDSTGNPSSMNSTTPLKFLSDGSLEGTAPSSSNFMITGPGGYRLFIPIKKLQVDFNHSNFTSQMTVHMDKNAAMCLERDIREKKHNAGVW